MEMIHSRLKILPLLLAVFVLCTAAAAYAGEQAYLGVMLQPLTVDLKEAMDVKRDLRGVLISEVIDESPAAAYGLRDGDIIIDIGGEEIDTVKGAVAAINAYAPGEEVKIVVLRDGDMKEVVAVTLGERGDEEKMVEKFHLESLPDITRHFEGFQKGFQRGPQGFLGVRIENISTSDLGAYFGVDRREGVLVIEVVEDSPAEEAGILAGDVILKVEGKDVTSTDNLVKYIRKYDPGDEVDLTVKRKRRTRTVEVELGKTAAQAKVMMKGDRAPGKCRIEKIKLPDIEKIGKKIKVHHDKNDGKVRIYTYGDDDMEDMEIFDFESDEFENDMEKIEKEMEELKQELKELKKELGKVSGR
ncbi:MAG: PDZ domain-containing protein [Candidatus Eisenbacteria bacterium]